MSSLPLQTPRLMLRPYTPADIPALVPLIGAREVATLLSHTLGEEESADYLLTEISKPILQHGTYSFYFWDCDLNCWEILTNPKGGYSWLFPLGDLEGKGHQDKSFKRPGVKTPD